MLGLFVIAALTLTAAGVAMALRNLIHSVLLLIGSWAGIAAFYLWAGAEFVAFAQLLIYVGAVSMVVLFAVLLTRQSHGDVTIARVSGNRTLSALVVGGAVFAVLVYAITSTALPASRSGAPTVTVHELGHALMSHHAAALLVIGLILTVALVGGVVLAATERRTKREGAP